MRINHEIGGSTVRLPNPEKLALFIVRISIRYRHQSRKNQEVSDSISVRVKAEGKSLVVISRQLHNALRAIRGGEVSLSMVVAY